VINLSIFLILSLLMEGILAMVSRYLNSTRLSPLIIFFLLLPFSAVGPSHAAESERAFHLILSFTDVTVGPGQEFEMDVDVANPGKDPVLVLLKTESVPEGWEAGFHSRYPSCPVRSVMVEGEKSKTLEFKVDVPDKVEGKSYEIKVSASDRNGQNTTSETITFLLSPKKVETGGLKTESQYPDLTGPTNQSFNFSVDLKNETDKDLTAALTAEAPAGWRVRIKPQFEDNVISSVALKKDSSQTLSVEIDPPFLAKAGGYPVTFKARSGSFTAERQFKVNLTGTYDLIMGVPTIGNTLALKLNTSVTVGKKTDVEFLVANTGTAPLLNLAFDATKPEGWSVEFEPKKLDSLNPGDIQTVTTTIQTSDRTVAGDYLLTVRSDSPDARKSIDFRVTVATPTLWGWIGAGIVAAVVLGLGLVFVRLGRR